MKRIVLMALMAVGIVGAASAQRDDLYFVPKKKKVEQVEEKPVVKQPEAPKAETKPAPKAEEKPQVKAEEKPAEAGFAKSGRKAVADALGATPATETAEKTESGSLL